MSISTLLTDLDNFNFDDVDNNGGMRRPVSAAASCVYLTSALKLLDILQGKRGNTRRSNSRANISSNYRNNPADEMLLQIMAQEAILESQKFILEDGKDIELSKIRLEKLIENAASSCDKLALEHKVREAATSLVKLKSDIPAQMQSAVNQLAQSNIKIEGIASSLIDDTACIISMERQILQHTCAVLRHELVNNPGTNGSSENHTTKKLSFAESRIKDQDAAISLLQTKVDAQSSRISSTDIRKSKSSDPTAAEHNRLKLDNATTRAELTTVQEDLVVERERAANTALHLEDEKDAGEVRDRKISELQSELEQIYTQAEMNDNGNLRQAILRLRSGDSKIPVRSSSQSHNTLHDAAALLDELSLERERSVRLEEKLNQMMRQATRSPPPRSIPESSTTPGSDTETEDESDNIRKRRLPSRSIPSTASTACNHDEKAIEILNKRICEYELHFNDLSALQQAATKSTHQSPFEKNEFCRVIANIIEDKDEAMKKIKQGASVLDELEKVKIQLCNSTNEMVESKSRMNIEYESAQVLSKGEFIKSQKTISELQKQIESDTNTNKMQLSNVAIQLTKSQDFLEKMTTERDDLTSKNNYHEQKFANSMAALTTLQSQLDEKVKENAQLSIKVRKGESAVQRMADAMEASMAIDISPLRASSAAALVDSGKDLLPEIERLQSQIVALKTQKAELLEQIDNEQHTSELLRIEACSLKKQLERPLGNMLVSAAIEKADMHRTNSEGRLESESVKNAANTPPADYSKKQDSASLGETAKGWFGF